MLRECAQNNTYGLQYLLGHPALSLRNAYIDSLLHETQDESRRLLRLRNQTTKASATAFICPTAHSTKIHYPKLNRLYRTPKLLKLSIGHLGRVWGCPAGFFSSRRPIRAGQSTLCCPCWACVDVKVGSCSRSSFFPTRSRYKLWLPEGMLAQETTGPCD